MLAAEKDAASRVSTVALLRAPSFYELHQAAECDPRGAFGDPGFVVFHPGGAGYVEVDPGGVFGKFFQEHGGGDGAALAAAGVYDIGDVGLDTFFVFFVEGKTPHFFARLFVGAGEAVEHIVVAGKDSGVDVAEGHDDGAGQGGGVYQMRAAQLAGVAEAVGQDQASFGVGVDDLDGLAGHGDLHVSRLLRFAGGHVFGGTNDGGNFHFGLEQGDGAHGADHGGGSGHVVLHFLHAVGGLDGDAAGVEGDTFADQAEVNVFCGALGVVTQHDQGGRFVGSLGHSPEGAHLELSDFVAIMDFALQADFGGHLFRALGEDGWRHAIGGFVGEVAGEVLRFGDDAGRLHGAFQRLGIV